MKARNKTHTTIDLEALTTDGQIPEWIELLPAGQEVKGRDGRSWKKSNPAKVLNAFENHHSRPSRIPIDVEHATELQAPKGYPAPAVGWIEEMKLEANSSIWGRVNWNEAGKHYLSSQSYKFLSPVILYDKSGEIQGINSVGLTNDPNLLLTALNRAEHEHFNPEQTMKPIITALGLKEGASESDMVQAIEDLKSQNQSLGQDLQLAKNQASNPSLNPSLRDFVPRADYDKALNRAAESEKALQEIQGQQQEEAIEALVQQAVKEGKIAPASVEYHKSACRAEGGIKSFEEFVKTAPAVIADATPPQNTPDEQKALNGTEKQIFSMLGVEESESTENQKEEK